MNYDYIVLIISVLVVSWLLFGKALTKQKPKQTTWCFCPACKVDLCSNDSLIYDDLDKSEVVYKCKNKGCGNVSWWNFDIAPCPILIKSDEGSSDIKPKEEATCENVTTAITE